MPRPRASPDIKALALDFACVVTTDEGADGSSFVARHGPHSIYAVLTRCCIGAIRDHTPESNRKGISEAEFLRALAERAKPVHKREFLRFRDRKAVKMSDDPTGAGMCMFCNVRWRSPANPTDLKYLREQHKSLSKKYPLVAGTVLESWLETLTAVTSACLARKRGRDWPEHDGSLESRPTKVVKKLPTHLAVSRSQGRQDVRRPNGRQHVAQVPARATQAPVKGAPPSRGDSPVSAQSRVSASTTSSFALCGSSHCVGKCDRKDVVVPVPSLESLAVTGELEEPDRNKASLKTEHPDLLQTVRSSDDGLWEMWSSDDGLWEMSPMDLQDMLFVSASRV
jgi:hypothetical protein